ASHGARSIVCNAFIQAATSHSATSVRVGPLWAAPARPASSLPTTPAPKKDRSGATGRRAIRLSLWSNSANRFARDQRWSSATTPIRNLLTTPIKPEFTRRENSKTCDSRRERSNPISNVVIIREMRDREVKKSTQRVKGSKEKKEGRKPISSLTL